MKIFLNNSKSLADLTLTVNSKGKCESVSILNCTKINAKQLVDDILRYQDGEVTAGRQTERTLKRIDIDLPTVNGTKQLSATYSDIDSYTSLSGLTDDGEEIGRPKMNGNMYVTDYLDEDELAVLKSKYESTDLEFHTPYIVEWDDVAVQTLDSTKANYNPAAAIVLYRNGVGKYLSNAPRWDGKYLLSKSEAKTIKNIDDWFTGVTSVSDTDSIVSKTAASYNLTQFNELESFTGLTKIDSNAFISCDQMVSIKIPEGVKTIKNNAFTSCSKLTTASLPSSLSSIGDNVFCDDKALKTMNIPDNVVSIGESAYKGCSNVEITSLPSKLSTIMDETFNGCEKMTISELPESLNDIGLAAFSNCKNITISSLPSGISSIKANTFKNCEKITVDKLPENVSYVGLSAFDGCSQISSMTIENQDQIVKIEEGAFDSEKEYDIIVGTKQSSWKSNNFRKTYVQNGKYSDRFKSLFKETYRALIPDSYEIQDYVTSDGKTVIDPAVKYQDGTKFTTDMAFASIPSSGTAVHGSARTGLFATELSGVQGKLQGVITVLTPASEMGTEVNNYTIDLPNSEMTKDGVQMYKFASASAGGQNNYITFFGESTNAFIGTSWFTRIYNYGETTHDFIPVKRKVDDQVGFYDINTGSFYGSDEFTSDTKTFTVGNDSGDTLTTEDGLTIVF